MHNYAMRVNRRSAQTEREDSQSFDEQKRAHGRSKEFGEEEVGEMEYNVKFYWRGEHCDLESVGLKQGERKRCEQLENRPKSVIEIAIR